MPYACRKKSTLRHHSQCEKLEQATRYKYLGSWVTEDGKCDLEVKARIGMAKDAFWKYRAAKR